MELQKKGMTDEERLELAAKLDEDLDQFINSLEKKRYTEGWPEDRWEEEMDKHPFFMKKAPEPGDELHPMLEGLQQLKYDPMENTTEDLAATYKEDGNFYVKHKKFNMAIYSYTEGIKMKCQNQLLNSTLLNNRSAAQYFLKNYRSSLNDAIAAIKINPNYVKALFRAAQCTKQLSKYSDCIEWCNKLLAIEPDHLNALDLRKTVEKLQKEKERDMRKQMAIERKQSEENQKLFDAIQLRNIRFQDRKSKPDGWTFNVNEELIQPYLAPLENFRVHLLTLDDGANTLIWPAAFCYPEFLFSDFQQKVDERILMIDILSEMLVEPLEIDVDKRYQPNLLNVYFENNITATVHKINVQHSIGEIISNKSFLVTGGCLVFYLVPKDSTVEMEYLKKQRHPNLNF